MYQIYSIFIVFENASAIRLSKWEGNEEIQIFREYLQTPAVQPNADYRKMLSRILKLLFPTKSFIYRASRQILEETSSQLEFANHRSLPS